MNGGIYNKRGCFFIRNRNVEKTPFLASNEYLRFRLSQSDFSEISLTVFLYFKWYGERKYSETKYYVSQCPITSLIILAWTRRFQIIAKVLLKWRKLFIIQITFRSSNVEARRFILKGIVTGRDMPHGRLQFLLAHTAIFRSYPR